jgi:hypothetical protein
MKPPTDAAASGAVQPNKDLVINTQGGSTVHVGEELSTLQSRFDVFSALTSVRALPPSLTPPSSLPSFHSLPLPLPLPPPLPTHTIDIRSVTGSSFDVFMAQTSVRAPPSSPLPPLPSPSSSRIIDIR